MKNSTAWLLAGAALLAFAGKGQAADTAASIQISPPGVFGRIDIGGLPQPRLVLSRPVIIAGPPPAPAPGVRVDVARPAPVVAQPQPIYMWVPPEHRRDWKRHCHQYRACGVPVYFVHDDWYHQHVHPRGRGEDGGHDRGHDRDGRGKGRERD